jgi:hypothetical protein
MLDIFVFSLYSFSSTLTSGYTYFCSHWKNLNAVMVDLAVLATSNFFFFMLRSSFFVN